MRRAHRFALGITLGVVAAACAPAAPTKNANSPAPHQSIAAGTFQTFEDSLARLKADFEAARAQPLPIPVPKDAGGGYTHERHKKNYKLIYNAGQLYQLTGEKKYADAAGQWLSTYADVYPAWGLHPEQKEQTPGRMFWQSLNEAMWLVYVAPSYGAIKDTLSDEQRDHIETNLLRNMADYLSAGQPQTFDKIHNHGTWANAAVGLTGYAIGDQNYVDQALLGLDKSGKSGFLAQMDALFSPDGYYNEGPYYQRFALMPFVLFGQAVEKNEPERKIFERRDGILQKAITSLIQQNYGTLFFPINDSIKEKGIATVELKYGVAIAYDLTKDPSLLSIAAAQGGVVPTLEGRAVSQALEAGLAKPFNYKSMRLSDGPKGDQGALDILRASSDPDDLAVVVKNTSQGLGHGHFDKMGILVYDAGHEILRDYGAARFLNVEAKYGGHYLRENNSFAKQSIAHNVLVVDEQSHFGGDVDIGNANAPAPGPFIGEGNLKITSASIDTAYPNVNLSRTVAMITDAAFARPVIIDLVEAHADGTHQYDLPFYYNGQITETNFPIQAETKTRKPLGKNNGYQHLWEVAKAGIDKPMSQMTFLLDKQFYSVSTAIPAGTEAIIAEIGAADPDINLRREPAFILRSKKADGVSYVSVIEPHGEYNATDEYTLGSHSHISKVEHFENGPDELVIITTKSGEKIGIGMADDVSKDAVHSIRANGKDYSWTGPAHIFHSNAHKNKTKGE